jgi:deoxyribose-phosphate aldolase
MKNIKDFSSFVNENYKLNENNSEIENYLHKIDYTNLEPSATIEDIEQLCKNASKFKVATVCILPSMVKNARKFLEEFNIEFDSDVKVCTVVSFPDGDDSLEEKYSETEKCLIDGANEIDMVLDYKKLKESQDDVTYDYLIEDVSQLAELVHQHNKILKVIVESGLLTEEQTEIATNICLEANADFIKTSTGKVSVGAELNKIKIMKDTIDNSGKHMKIKASGGIRTIEDIKRYNTLVDRFGVGYKAVDNMVGLSDEKSTY